MIYVQYKLDKSAFKRFEQFLDLDDDYQLENGRRVTDIDGNINIENLSFSYGDRKIFDGLNLTIQKGEKVAFVGESGSGKSTLVKIIAGLIIYDTGSVMFGREKLRADHT